MKEVSFEELKEKYEKVLSDYFEKEISISNDDFVNDLSNSSVKNDDNGVEEREIEISYIRNKRIEYFIYYEQFEEDIIRYFI